MTPGKQVDIESIWQQYSNNLTALLRSKVSNPADVDDLLQEILIKTHTQIGTLRSGNKLKSWLYQLANNTIIDFYRKRGRNIDVSVDELWYGDEGNDESYQQQLSRCILPFIHALPPATAGLLQAIDIEGQSQKRYAAESGISYSALKSRVQRGRTQLRGLFEQCCHLELDRHGNVIECQAKAGSCQPC